MLKAMKNGRIKTKKKTLRDLITSKMSKEERGVLIEREASEYLAICRDESCHPITKKVKKSKHFLKWAVKLLLPDFIVGHPNLFDNFRTLRTHPQFHAFRRAIIAWIIFTLVVSSSGIYSLITAKHGEAQGQFYFKTGYYLGSGDGVTKHIKGLGFKPEVLIIKSDTSMGQTIFKTAAMPEGEYAYFDPYTDNSENQITFEDDGFSVGLNVDVNSDNVIYKYIAFAGNDCSSGGIMCYGSYAGNAVTGSYTKDIDTGFSPDLVIVKRAVNTGGGANFLTSAMPTGGAGYAGFFSGTADDITANYFPAGAISNNGFTVGYTNNAYGGLFYYLSFKKGSGFLDVGSYTGSGSDQTISPPLMSQVTPDFVITKAKNNNAAVFNITQSYGDYSSRMSTAGANVTGAIKQLVPGGFVVGNSVYSNSNNTGYWYFSFAGAADPVTSGSFLMRTGSYVGDGNANRIIQGVGFTPDLVIIKSSGNDYGIWSTSMDYNLSRYLSQAAGGIKNAIINMNSDGFVIGTDPTVNTYGVTYQYQAFGNATGPSFGGRAADFAIGAYTGNFLDNRSITNLGINPDFVAIKGAYSDGGTVWSSTAIATRTTVHFAPLADDTTGNLIKRLDPGGFSVGASNIVNRNGYVNNFFAFSKSAAFAIGLYTGSGSQQDITTTNGNTPIGFTPDYVIVKRTAAFDAVHRSSDINLGNNTQYFKNTADFANGITDIVSGGFRVSTNATVNTSSKDYHFLVWKASTPTSSPETPLNISPANNTLNIDLNPTLTGSQYNDSNPQTGIMWQVSENPDFSTLVWERATSSAENSVVVNSTNGNFTGILVGKNYLQHNKNYYWKVKYSNGVFSRWSTTTNFTTWPIDSPINSSPQDQRIVNILTPTLTASQFSDPQAGHTAVSSEWQIDSKINFTSPIYDSGVVNYSNSITVPEATLSDKTVYYWRVRYLDSSGDWSGYSLPTRFLISKEAEFSVIPLFGSTVVNQGDIVKIDAQIKSVDGSTINDATSTISIFDPSGIKIINNQAMSYLTGSNGIYRYAYTIPNLDGSYLYEVSAESEGSNGFGAANFEVRNLASDIASTKSTVEQTQIVASDTKTIVESNQITIENTNTLASSTEALTNSIKSTVENTKANLDILVGAFIVTQGSINDSSATINSFISSLNNSTDNFYKNAVLTFTSGSLNGQSRRVSGYNGTTKTITLDPELTSTPANGDTFTITTQNVRVEEQVAEHEASSSAFRNDTTSRLISIEGKVDTILSTLNTIDSNLDTVQNTLNIVRNAQNDNYQVELSDISKIQIGGTYRAKLTILDFHSKPVDASTTPTITLYDSTRAIVASAVSMSKLSTGVYEYTYTLNASSTAGIWEAISSVNLNGSEIVKNDYFEVAGSPAQVFINSISDASVPSISANTTITNEGNTEYEYHYEWCVVSTESDPCGGSNDVYYASGAKLINPGESFTPVLTANVASVGNYWFKLVVYYGSEVSAASRSFTANAEGDNNGSITGGSYISPSSADHADIYEELTKVHNQLDLNSQKLAATLDSLGIINPILQNLLSINNINSTNLKDVQNKVADLKAVSATTRKIVEDKATTPIVETYMKFNSVEIHFLITNPSDQAQTLKFKAFLPAEAKPENIVNLDGLQVDYDTNAKNYYVYGNISLQGKETITRKVEMKDIWQFTEEEIEAIKKQADDLLQTLKKSQYETEGVLLKNNIESTLNVIALKQKESYSSPQEHILVYRENQERMIEVKNNLDKLKSLLVEAGASRSIVGNIGGIQTFATWGIILAIVFGFALLSLVIFAMWRHQTILASQSLGIPEQEIHKHFGRNISDKYKNKDIEVDEQNEEIEGVYREYSWFKKIILWLILSGAVIGLGILVTKYIYNFKDSKSLSFLTNIESKQNDEVNESNILIQNNLQNSEENNSSTSNELTSNNESDNSKTNTMLKILDTEIGWLNVREEASTLSKVINKVYPEEEYEYIDKKDNWYKIILKDKTEGWVFNEYVKTID